MENDSHCISVKDAAELLGIGQSELRLGLVTGALPFGAAIPRQRGHRTTYRYIIPKARFTKWVNGDDLVNRVPLTDNIIKFNDGRVFIRTSCLTNDSPIWKHLREEAEKANSNA